MGPPRIADWLQRRINQIVKDPPTAESTSQVSSGFCSSAEYSQLYLHASCMDYEVEREPIDNFNEREISVRAWVMKHSPSEGFILRLDTGKLGTWPKPKIGDSCLVEFQETTDTSFIYDKNDQLEAQLSPDKVPVPGAWWRTVEVILPVPPFVRYSELRELLESLSLDGKELPKTKDEAKSVMVKIWLKLSWQTLAAEIACLDRLMELTASETGNHDSRVHAFKYLIDFKSAAPQRNLLERFPTLSNMAHVPDPSVRAKISARMSKLLEDDFQSEAFNALRSIPAGLQIIPGGFGSGKSSFCMLMAAVAQAGTRPVKVLYMIDVNRSLDNAAKEMVKMYNDLGMKCVAIRMRPFPVEWRDAEFGKPEEIRREQWEQLSLKEREERKAKREQKDVNPWPELSPDHRRCFVQEWKNTRHLRLPTDALSQPADDFKALSLDAAAFNHYEQNKANLPRITAALESLKKNADDRNLADWHNIDDLEQELVRLYDEIIDRADFIAMTPCAAYTYARHLWSRCGGPDIVVLDEAGHCRELSSLIPIACFEKATWFITGDHRQSSPRVSDSLFKSLLRRSLLERATLLRKDLVAFNTTFRSYQGLHLMPSKVFYDDSIRASKCQGSPESSHHLLRKLNNMKYGAGMEVKLKVPRLIVNSENLGDEYDYEWHRYDNPAHRAWVMKKAREFLDDPEFTHVNSTRRGSILIITPYKKAFDNYKRKIQTLPKSLRERISASTVDLSQGTSADLVFVDMVVNHGTPFNTDPKLLCAALTRSRQAEIIVMSREMLDSHYIANSYLRKIWHSCGEENGGAIMTMTI